MKKKPITDSEDVEQQFIKKWKKHGFSLFKTKPTHEKLRLLFKIQKLVKDI